MTIALCDVRCENRLVRRIEKEIIIDQRAEIVFDYLADMSGLREWAPEDSVEVRALDEAPIGLRKRFEYETTGAHARSWFGWDVFEPPRHLAFSGPRVNVGPGWVEGRGDYILEPLDGRTWLRAAIMPVSAA